MGVNRQGAIGGAPNVQTDGTIKIEHVGETSDFTGEKFTTSESRALEVELVMRVVGTGSVTVIIERFDKASQTWIMVLTGAAIVTNSTNRYKVSPDLAAVANSIAQDHLADEMRVRVTHGNANAVTYSLSYHLAS